MSDIHPSDSMKVQKVLHIVATAGTMTAATMTVLPRLSGTILIGILKAKLGREMSPRGILRVG
jgi:hypothetical protein